MCVCVWKATTKVLSTLAWLPSQGSHTLPVSFFNWQYLWWFAAHMHTQTAAFQKAFKSWHGPLFNTDALHFSLFVKSDLSWLKTQAEQTDVRPCHKTEQLVMGSDVELGVSVDYMYICQSESVSVSPHVSHKSAWWNARAHPAEHTATCHSWSRNGLLASQLMSGKLILFNRTPSGLCSQNCYNMWKSRLKKVLLTSSNPGISVATQTVWKCTLRRTHGEENDSGVLSRCLSAASGRNKTCWLQKIPVHLHSVQHCQQSRF